MSRNPTRPSSGNHRTNRLAATALATSLVIPWPALAAEVVVVDAAGVGASFTDLQSGIDAAPDGSIVLVKTGSYSPFIATGRSLTIVADLAHTVDVTTGSPFAVDELGDMSDHAIVEGVPPGGTFVIRGIRFRGLEVRQCQGAVFLEDVNVGITAPTCRVSMCSQVVAHRTTFDGPDGLATADLSAFKQGGGALEVLASNVAFTDCLLRGGDGQDFVASVIGAFPDEPGHIGLIVDQAATVMLYRSTLEGGQGGDGGSDGSSCFDAMNGAPALDLRSGTAYRKASSFVGGLGGGGFQPSGPCPLGGAPGASSPGIASAPLTQLLDLPGPNGSVSVTSPTREGALARFTVLGPANGVFLLGVALDPALLFQPGLGGAMLVAPPLFPGFAIGQLGPNGMFRGSVVLGDLGPGVAGVRIVTQSMICARSGGCTLGAASSLVALDLQY